MKTHATRLAELQSRGWSCEHPDKFHHPVSRTGEHHKSVYLEGTIHCVPQSLFRGVATGLVMVLRGDDYEFDLFLQYIDGKPIEAKVLKGQRGLFGEDNE